MIHQVTGNSNYSNKFVYFFLLISVTKIVSVKVLQNGLLCR